MAEPIDVGAAHAAVAGTDFEVVYAVAPGGVEGGYLIPMGLMVDGRTAAVQVPAGASDGGPWLAAPMSVGVLDGGTFTPFAAAAAIEGDHPRQAFDLSVADGVTAWLESDSTNVGTPRWRVFSAGRDGRTTLVARAEEVGDGGTSMTDATALWHGRVYWAAGEPGRMDVYSRAADGTGPVVSVATGASQPAAAGTGVAVVRSERDDTALAPGEARVELVVDGREQHAVVTWSGDPGSSVVDLVADGAVLAFVTITSTQSGGRLYVLDAAARTARTVELRGSGREASVALCDGRLQWSEADGQGLGSSAPTYVLDVASGDLASIDVDHAYAGAFCGGGYLAWKQLDAATGMSASTVVARWDR
ncbi:hypothetical protein HP550_02595 [Cellulomonas humilata]|uniref:Lipoprotein LpqB beta-propeller domain-containing protein n=1 Tax=Cellulomonas humilata TaxID=144055 RepID=A0A7Y5ZXY8_9CELL|nr:hypothetical protein [Cellulomonas humilata]NUU16139.1 hypothetical protein [Cellulomonas humilata]